MNKQVNHQDILGKKILVVIAHPDDESFLAAQLMKENILQGGEVLLLCATLGEKGTSHLDQPVSTAELKEIRLKELQAAAALSGISKVIELYFPDGEVCDHKAELKKQIKMTCQSFKPDVLVSFGPDGITGHKDHVAVGEVVAELREQYSCASAIFCLPESVAKQAQKSLKSKRKNGVYHDNLPLTIPNWQLPVDLDFKLSVLRVYQSQLDSEDPYQGIPEPVAKHMQSHESFYVDVIK